MSVHQSICPSVLPSFGVSAPYPARYFHKCKALFVRLSLLTMTNPNQLCDVLLFLCSKMADETNLSSKLPVADRTREV